MFIAQRLGQYDGGADYSGIDWGQYEDPGAVNYFPQEPAFDDSSFWNSPAWSGGTDYTQYDGPTQYVNNPNNPAYDPFSAFDWSDPTSLGPSGGYGSGSGNNPVPGYGPSGGGGGGGDVGGILGALKNLFSKNKSNAPGTTVTPAPHALTIAGVPVSMAVVGVAAVGVGVMFLLYRNKKRGRR